MLQAACLNSSISNASYRGNIRIIESEYSHLVNGPQAIADMGKSFMLI